jgi:hypothetical protein
MIYMHYYNNTMKKVSYIMILLFLSALTGVNGQGMGQGMGQMQGQADNEKLTAYKIAFFTQRLDLTPAEAEKFWPLYNDFSARKNKLQADRIALMRYASQNETNMSQGELSSTADKLAQTFVDEASLVVSFNNDLKKVLPPAKVIKLFQIENQYKQQLLRELNQRRQGMRGRENQLPVREQ